MIRLTREDVTAMMLAVLVVVMACAVADLLLQEMEQMRWEVRALAAREVKGSHD